MYRLNLILGVIACRPGVLRPVIAKCCRILSAGSNVPLPAIYIH